uniref:Uncharacterized protein n=1 Tax=Panagrolaimus sp. PS1159 TaxID=55785 RepID=A0AC35GJJ2_9BILA
MEEDPEKTTDPTSPSEGYIAATDSLPYPLDIVVHHINQAVQHQQDDDSEDETVFEVNYELKKEGFKVTNKDNGADFEFSETDNVEAAKPTSSTTAAPKPITNKDNGADFEFSETDNVEAAKPTSSTTAAPKPNGSAKFRKGHRRAWSMPNAKDKAVLVVADDSINEDGQQKRHVVRYRLHPYRLDDEKTSDAVNSFIQASNFDIEFPLDDEDINLEEDGMCFPGVGTATKGTRTVMKR